MSSRQRRSRARPQKTALNRPINVPGLTIVKKPKAYESNPDSQSSSRCSTPQSKQSLNSKPKINSKLLLENAGDFVSGNYLDHMSENESSDHESHKNDDEIDEKEDESSDHSLIDAQSIISEDSLSSLSQNKILHRPKSLEILDDKEIPDLKLPESSTDLLIPNVYIMQTLGIYEVIWHFRNILKLSPFRFEDFCAVLLNEDHCALLSQLHIALIKALLREDEVASTSLGPQDLKDSINISMFFVDGMTWPEVIRQYLESDPHIEFEKALQCLENGNYPFVPLSDKLTVLRTLTDLFVSTTLVREEILNEGNIHYDDHCRACHRLGDLLCCETCPAVYHLMCVNPPLEEVPEDDWQCSICQKHEVKGLSDCMSEVEKNRIMCRQDPIGYDRHGRKYYFLIRRILVCSDDNDEMWYYSTEAHLQELIDCLDSMEWEYYLCQILQQYRDEISMQMSITLELTKEVSGSKKNILEYETAELKKVQDERAKKKALEEAVRFAKEQQALTQAEGLRQEQKSSEETDATTDVSKTSGTTLTSVIHESKSSSSTTETTITVSSENTLASEEMTIISMTSVISTETTTVSATVTTTTDAESAISTTADRTADDKPIEGKELTISTDDKPLKPSTDSEDTVSTSSSLPVKIIKSPGALNAKSLIPNLKVSNLKGFTDAKSGKTLVFVNKDGKLTLSAVTDKDQKENETITQVSSATQAGSATDVTDSDSAIESRKMLTRSRTGSLTPKLFSDSVTVTTGSLLKAKSAIASSSEESIVSTIEDDIQKLSRAKTQVSTSSTATVSTTAQSTSIYFRLGQEKNYKQYVNEFSTNSLALNKHQHNDERDRKRYLSHKFSLTPLSEFKWNGGLHGNKALITATLRGSITQLESHIPTSFLHPNWPLHRQNWQKAVHMCNNANDFALALAILEACIKPVLFNPVWRDSLGHLKLTRYTLLQREDIRKKEKIKKKEEDDEANSRILWVKYTLGLKHLVFKQKGEEYRVTGNGGWIWISSQRTTNFVSQDSVGLRSIAQKFLLNKRTKFMDEQKVASDNSIIKDEVENISKTSELSSNEQNPEETESVVPSHDVAGETVKSNKSDASNSELKPVRYDFTGKPIYVDLPEIVDELIDVTQGLLARTYYVDCKKGPSKLDSLLDRRIKQEEWEGKQRSLLEQQIALKMKEELKTKLIKGEDTKDKVNEKGDNTLEIVKEKDKLTDKVDEDMDVDIVGDLVPEEKKEDSELGVNADLQSNGKDKVVGNVGTADNNEALKDDFSGGFNNEKKELADSAAEDTDGGINVALGGTNETMKSEGVCLESTETEDAVEVTGSGDAGAAADKHMNIEYADSIEDSDDIEEIQMIEGKEDKPEIVSLQDQKIEKIDEKQDNEPADISDDINAHMEDKVAVKSLIEDSNKLHEVKIKEEHTNHKVTPNEDDISTIHMGEHDIKVEADPVDVELQPKSEEKPVLTNGLGEDFTDTLDNSMEGKCKAVPHNKSPPNGIKTESSTEPPLKNIDAVKINNKIEQKENKDSVKACKDNDFMPMHLNDNKVRDSADIIKSLSQTVSSLPTVSESESIPTVSHSTTLSKILHGELDTPLFDKADGSVTSSSTPSSLPSNDNNSTDTVTSVVQTKTESQSTETVTHVSETKIKTENNTVLSTSTTTVSKSITSTTSSSETKTVVTHQSAASKILAAMSVSDLRAKIPPVRTTYGTINLARFTRQGIKRPTRVAMKKGSLPVCQKFQNKHKNRSLFILEKHELKSLARLSGLKETKGFNYNCKMSNVNWEYPCPRPLFKTAWRYRTQTLQSLSAASLQLRILWGCLRWDDLSVKPPAGGTNTTSTESEITTTELLKRRDVGPYGLTSQFLVRKIIVPLGLPGQPKETYTPIRSGLRERRRAESPKLSEPSVTEVWMPEESLEIWEIKQFGEKLERQRQILQDREKEKEKAALAASVKDNHTVTAKGKTLAEIKSQLEAQLKQQQLASKQQQQKKITENRSNSVTSTSSSVSTSSMKIVTSMSPLITSLMKNVIPSTASGGPGQRPIIKVQMTNTPGHLRVVNSSGINQSKAIVVSQAASTTVGASTPVLKGNAATQIVSPRPVNTQSVQIVQGPSGNLQVRGLLPGQQIVRLPDGRLQLITIGSSQTSTNAAPPLRTPNAQTAVIRAPVSVRPQQHTIKMIGGQRFIIPSSVSSLSPHISSTTKVSPAQNVLTASSSKSVTSPTIPIQQIIANKQLFASQFGSKIVTPHVLSKSLSSSSAVSVLSSTVASSKPVTPLTRVMVISTASPIMSSSLLSSQLTSQVSHVMSQTSSASYNIISPHKYEHTKSGGNIPTIVTRIRRSSGNSFGPSTGTDILNMSQGISATNRTTPTVISASGTTTAHTVGAMSLLNTSGAATEAADITSPTGQTPPLFGKYTVTQQVVQQVVRQALLQNQTPEIQAKLLAMQRQVGAPAGKHVVIPTEEIDETITVSSPVLYPQKIGQQQKEAYHIKSKGMANRQEHARQQACMCALKSILDRIDRDEKTDMKRQKKIDSNEERLKKAAILKVQQTLHKHKESLKGEILRKRAKMESAVCVEIQVC